MSEERSFSYLNVDSLIKNLLWLEGQEFTFSIKSNNGIDEKLMEDFGINESNTLNTINQWDGDIDENHSFIRVFIFDNRIFVCNVNISFDGEFLNASVSSPMIFDKLIDFYRETFQNGIAYSPFQIEQIFGKKNNPIDLMKKSFSKYGYEYVSTDDYDDWGLMYNVFKKDDLYFFLIGPQIDIKYLIRTNVYFDLYCYNRLLENYGKSMCEIPELYLSFGELFSIIKDEGKLLKYLISDKDFKSYYFNKDEIS